MESNTKLQAVRQFKGSAVFDWETEPADERPSEFTSSRQGLDRQRSARYDGIEVRRQRPPLKRGGMSVIGRAMVLVVMLAGAGMVAATYLLRG